MIGQLFRSARCSTYSIGGFGCHLSGRRPRIATPPLGPVEIPGECAAGLRWSNRPASENRRIEFQVSSYVRDGRQLDASARTSTGIYIRYRSWLSLVVGRLRLFEFAEECDPLAVDTIHGSVYCLPISGCFLAGRYIFSPCGVHAALQVGQQVA